MADSDDDIQFQSFDSYFSGLPAATKPIGSAPMIVFQGGTTRQIPASSVGTVGRQILTANLTYFVNITGSDSNNGLTPATAFATLQHVMNVIAGTLDLASFTVFINIGSGSFVGLSVLPCVGSGVVTFIGNGISNTIILDGPNDGINNFGECIDSNLNCPGTIYSFDSLALQNHGIGNPECVVCYQPTTLLFGFAGHNSVVCDCTFMTSGTLFDMLSGPGGNIIVSNGAAQIKGGGGTITQAWIAEGTIGTTLSMTAGLITGTLTVTNAFAVATGDSTISVSQTFTGVNTVTGKRFIVNTGGQIFGINPGSLGANFFPGTVAGTVDDDVSSYDGLYGTEYPQAFSALPVSPLAGEEFTINDGKAANCGDGSCTTWGTHVTAGGGALNLKIRWNGANWTLMGI